jgi:hypothetical protein
VLDAIVAAAMTLHASLPERTDHFDGLLEHLEPLGSLRPRVAEDVLVERLA